MTQRRLSGKSARVRKWYETHGRSPENRAKRLFYDARQRARRAGLPFTIKLDDVVRRMLSGRCEATGVEFVFSRAKTRHHPLAPSLDRFNNKRAPMVITPLPGACIRVSEDGSIVIENWKVDGVDRDAQGVGLAIVEWVRDRASQNMHLLNGTLSGSRLGVK